MRAAEAMRLGFIGGLKPVAGVRYDGRGGGCALGAIQAAHGVNLEKYLDGVCSVERYYPWLREPVRLPRTTSYGPEGSRVSGVTAIASLFNQHVMADPPTMTIEELADWIESVDPTPRTQEVAPEAVTEPVHQQV
jgi:hypothetical protein